MPVQMGRWRPNSLVRQRLSGVERVTGIEPALSAWELFELIGFVLGSLRFSRSRSAWSVPWMPAVMERQWHESGRCVDWKSCCHQAWSIRGRFGEVDEHGTQLGGAITLSATKTLAP